MLENNYNIQVLFNRGVEVSIQTEEQKIFLIEVYEHFAGDTSPRIIDTTIISSNDYNYLLYRNWHGNFSVKVYDWNDNIRLVYSKELNLFNKSVLFVTHELDAEEQKTWWDLANKMAKRYGFMFTMVKNNEDYNQYDYYRVYHLGRFVSDAPHTLHEFPLYNRQIWRKYFNEFNPRNWDGLSSTDIFNDITGISENTYNEKFVIKSMYL